MSKQTGVPETRLEHLPRAQSIDDVIANFNTIIAWAIADANGIGYFATVYKRATIAIKAKIEEGDYFDDNERMEAFDMIFANRYFSALNAYFHPDDYQAPTHTWQWCFDGHEYDPPDAPIILQHMLTAVNSHVNLDLGISAAQAVGDGPIDDLDGDFDRINHLLAEEVKVFLVTLSKFSTGVAVIRAILPCEDEVLNKVLRIFRNLAWSFAKQLSAQPHRHRGNVGIQDSWACVLGSYYLHTGESLDAVISYIRDGEDTDVANNIRQLDGQDRIPA